MEMVRKYEVVVICDEEAVHSFLHDLEVVSVDELVKAILAQVEGSEEKKVYLSGDTNTGLYRPLTELPTDAKVMVHVRTPVEFKGTFSLSSTSGEQLPWTTYYGAVSSLSINVGGLGWDAPRIRRLAKRGGSTLLQTLEPLCSVPPPSQFRQSGTNR
jgi:hypothetical protein